MQCMQDDIQNYLPTVMFRGTPCSYREEKQSFEFLLNNRMNLLTSYLFIIFKLEVLRANKVVIVMSREI